MKNIKQLIYIFIKRYTTRAVLLLLFPISLLLTNLAKSNPWFVERYYSSLFYPYLSRVVSFLPSLFNFSVAEAIIVLAPCALLLFVIVKVVHFIRLKVKIVEIIKAAAVFFLNLLCGFSLLYFIFISFWGINYYRPRLTELAGFDSSNITDTELYTVSGYLAKSLNDIRVNLSEDENGVVKSKKSLTEILSGSKEGYLFLCENYEFIKFIPHSAKPVFLSEQLSYLGISGIFIPHTAEPNVNVIISPCMLQATLCHEQAHQLGFAREEEANFISFLACINSTDLEFKYSGLMLAFIHSSNAYYRVDPQGYKQIMDGLSDAVYADLRHNWEFWNRYEGRAAEISNKANDSYLRSNGQTEGVKSYGAMVELVVGYYRTQK